MFNNFFSKNKFSKTPLKPNFLKTWQQKQTRTACRDTNLPRHQQLSWRSSCPLSKIERWRSSSARAQPRRRPISPSYDHEPTTASPSSSPQTSNHTTKLQPSLQPQPWSSPPSCSSDQFSSTELSLERPSGRWPSGKWTTITTWVKSHLLERDGLERQRTCMDI